MMEARYVPLVQQPYCCVPACIQMVLLRRRLQLLAQEEIGKELGLVVPKEYKKIFPTIKTKDKPSAGYGTQIHKTKYSLNSFFLKHRYHLKEEYYPLSRISNINNWLRNTLTKDNDIVVCFNYSKLYVEEGEGHVSLINSISGNNLILIDPRYKSPKIRCVSLPKLIAAIKAHGEINRAGFWVISSQNTR